MFRELLEDARGIWRDCTNAGERALFVLLVPVWLVAWFAEWLIETLYGPPSD